MENPKVHGNDTPLNNIWLKKEISEKIIFRTK